MKIALGLSGGVDSTISAYLLKRQGYHVRAVFFWAWDNPQSQKDLLMAKTVAQRLKIEFQILDLRQEYKKKVVDYFINEYSQGRIPSPDIICNREIKFGLFLDWALKHGFQKVATGHYARIKRVNNRLAIFQPKDLSKDQTYFLYQLSEPTLASIIWPLGEMKKKAVKELAKKLELPNWNRPESMGICFIGPNSIKDLLKTKIKFNSGKVKLADGTVIGQHHGAELYALGQRHNLTIKRPKKQLAAKYLYPNGDLRPLYVIKKDLKKNQLIVSVRQDCFIRELNLTNLTTVWSEEELENKRLLGRLRNLGRLTPGQLKNNNFIFEKDVFITSPGQSLVFYSPKGRLVGGGIINSVILK